MQLRGTHRSKTILSTDLKIEINLSFEFLTSNTTIIKIVVLYFRDRICHKISYGYMDATEKKATCLCLHGSNQQG